MASDARLQEAIRKASDPALVMQRLTEQAVRLIPAADGASLEMRVDEDTLEYVCCAGVLAGYVGMRLGVHTSLSGESLLSGQTRRCDDTEADPRVDAEAARRTGVRSMLCFPLGTATGIPALLKVTSQHPRAFGPTDQRTLASLGDFMRTALTSAAELARVTRSLLPTGSHDPAEMVSARFIAGVLQPGLLDTVLITEQISGLLESGGPEMVVQPIRDMHTGQVCFAEALARFHSTPARGPDVWFAQAHAVGMGIDLELAALRAAVDLLQVLPIDVSLCVNLGPHAVRSPQAADIVAPAAHRLVLEITEHEEVDPNALVGALADLRSTGVRIAFDDTGAGYASLANLLRIQPEIVKLDRSLVRGIDADPVRRALAGALVRFANEDLGAVVIAEGIETEAEAVTLVDKGIRFGQGYFLGRPAAVARTSWAPAWHKRPGLPLVTGEPPPARP